MSNLNTIADKIEEVILKTISYSNELKTDINNYALLYDQKTDNKWYIIFFFHEQVYHENSIKNGNCYHVYLFLQEELKQIDNDLPYSISFELGSPPSNKLEYEELLKKSTETYVSKGEQKISSKCGHSWNDHQLSGFIKEGETSPKEGWMICPHANCTCFITWDFKSK